MHLKKNEITLLYNADNASHRQTLAMATTINAKINKQDVSKIDVSATLFRVLVELLNDDVKSIVNKADPYYQQELRGSELSVRMWLLAIKNHPTLLKSPVALHNGKIMICQTPTDVLKLARNAA